MAPEIIILNTLLLSLALYGVLGGADFGAGVWELNTALQSSEKERRLIYRAIGPVWEANHVWLIFVLMVTLNAFPLAFAAICRSLWLPLLLALVGIVFRGVGYVFRSHEETRAGRELWGAAFAVASTAAPFFLGGALGSIASGRLAIDAAGNFTGKHLTGWLTPLSLYTAFFAVGMCAYLAAVFLTREARVEGDAELVRLWRQRALACGIWMGVLAAGGLALASAEATDLWDGLLARGWPFVTISALSGCLSLLAMWRHAFTLAPLAASLAVAAVLWGWGAAQYPVLVPPAITVEAAKAPASVLRAMVWGIAAGALVLIPSLAYLFYLFKRREPHAEGSVP